MKRSKIPFVKLNDANYRAVQLIARSAGVALMLLDVLGKSEMDVQYKDVLKDVQEEVKKVLELADRVNKTM